MMPLADMHTDGVYFDEEVKKEILKNREEEKDRNENEICQYSGLPSVRAYEQIQNLKSSS